jgi:Mg2+-importing ATPase
MIPADCRIIESKDLFISQATLTGETMPVEKREISIPDANNKPLLELENICFMGTNVVSGAAMVIVVNTGAATYLGSITQTLAEKRAETNFDKGVNSVSRLLIRFMLIMVPVIFLINGIIKQDWLEALLFAIAVAVGITPEMLPMVVTANLARGAMSMSRKKVIVKRLNAIQNIGAMDILCTDKTGTLTMDKIVLESYLNIFGERDKEVLKWAYLNSYHQTGLKNLMDVAILDHAEVHEHLHADVDFEKVDEIPFDFERKKWKAFAHLQGCSGRNARVVFSCI